MGSSYESASVASSTWAYPYGFSSVQNSPLVLVLFLLVKDFLSLVTHKLSLGVCLLLGSVLLLFGLVFPRHLVSIGSRLLSVSVLTLSRAMLPPSLPFRPCLPLQEVDHVSVSSLPLSYSLWE